MPNKDATRSVSAPPKAKKAESKKIEAEDVEDQFIAYANIVQLHVNAEEAAIQFGRQPAKGIDANRGEASQNVAKIYMTMPAFKRLIYTGKAIIEGIEDVLEREIDLDPNLPLKKPGSREKIDAKVKAVRQLTK